MLDCSRCGAFELRIREVNSWITAFTVLRDRAGKAGITDDLNTAFLAKEKLRSELQNAYSAHCAGHRPDLILSDGGDVPSAHGPR